MMRSRLFCTWRRLAARGGLAVGVGVGDQAQGDRGLAAVDVEELRGGLEVGAPQSAAVAVRQAVPDPGQVGLTHSAAAVGASGS